VTVTSLDAAADVAADEASAVLGDLVLDGVKFTAAALVGALGGGSGHDPELMAFLTAPRSYKDVWAMVLLLADCADKTAVAKGCGINPGLAAANAKRMAEARHKAREYAWLRDGNVIPDVAAERVGVTSEAGRSEYETAYRAGKKPQREGSEAA
jgi:hypothetical protein